MKKSKVDKKETVYIPDEWIPDYSKTLEENLKSLREHNEASRKAWAKLERNESK